MPNKTHNEMKNLIERINNELEAIDFGYEMGCLISVEFTPPPDYTSIFDVIGDKKDELIEYLDAQASKEFIELADEDFCGMKLGDMDKSYTPSGQMLSDILSITQQIEHGKTKI